MNITHHIFKKAEEQLAQNLPFAIYRKGYENSEISFKLKAFFQENDQLYETDTFSESGFIMGAFDLNSRKSPFIPIEYSTFTEEEIPVSDIQISPGHELIPSENKALQNQHEKLVEKGIETIRSNQLKKVVLSRKFSVATKDSPIEIYKRLLLTYPTAFGYLWYHPKVGMWLGATPETLLKINGKTLSTMALAGTKSALESEFPQWTSKEREEQQRVTDFIAETLEDKVTGLHIGEVESIKAGKLWHLKCDISARLNPAENLKPIIEAFHPTPAVCGTPKEESKGFIIENENYDREFYTGFVGELNLEAKNIRKANKRNVENQSYAKVEKNTELFVNLRCMQIKDNQAEIYVGGGVVKDSNPTAEWIETMNKSQTMLDIL